MPTAHTVNIKIVKEDESLSSPLVGASDDAFITKHWWAQSSNGKYSYMHTHIHSSIENKLGRGIKSEKYTNKLDIKKYGLKMELSNTYHVCVCVYVSCTVMYIT